MANTNIEAYAAAVATGTITIYDVCIKVTSPAMTHSLMATDTYTLYDQGIFTYTAPIDVEYEKTGNIIIKESVSATSKERIAIVSTQITDMLQEIGKILGVFANRAGNITLTYDTQSLANEALASAEETIFGTKTGKITYSMYEKVLYLEGKIDKWLSHSSMVNQGAVHGTTIS